MGAGAMAKPRELRVLACGAVVGAPPLDLHHLLGKTLAGSLEIPATLVRFGGSNVVAGAFVDLGTFIELTRFEKLSRGFE